MCMLGVVPLPKLAAAQLLPLPDQAQPAASAGVALEPELSLAAGYVQPLAKRAAFQSWFGGSLKWAPQLPLRGQLKASLLLTARYRAQRWLVACTGMAGLAHSADDAGSLFGIDAEVRCQPALLIAPWALGLDLGFQSALVTHVEHSALSRRTFEARYPDERAGVSGPHDAWYTLTSQRFRLGLGARHVFSPRWVASLALGSLFATQQQGELLAFNLMQVPVYLEFALSYAWW